MHRLEWCKHRKLSVPLLIFLNNEYKKRKPTKRRSKYTIIHQCDAQKQKWQIKQEQKFKNNFTIRERVTDWKICSIWFFYYLSQYRGVLLKTFDLLFRFIVSNYCERPKLLRLVLKMIWNGLHSIEKRF